MVEFFPTLPIPMPNSSGDLSSAPRYLKMEEFRDYMVENPMYTDASLMVRLSDALT